MKIIPYFLVIKYNTIQYNTIQQWRGDLVFKFKYNYTKICKGTRINVVLYIKYMNCTLLQNRELVPTFVLYFIL